jgi:hypothetical protein
MSSIAYRSSSEARYPLLATAHMKPHLQAVVLARTRLPPQTA